MLTTLTCDYGQGEGMKIMRWFVGSWVPRIYLAVVAAVFAYELWYLLTWDGPTMAGVLSYLLTAPTSWLLDHLLAGAGGGLWWWAWWAGIVLVSALGNIAAAKGIRALVHRLRPPARPAAGGLPGHRSQPPRSDGR